MHRAYKAHIISTIVDCASRHAFVFCLQGSYNFYYCRSYEHAQLLIHAYKAHIISTIVDLWQSFVTPHQPTRLI